MASDGFCSLTFEWTGAADRETCLPEGSVESSFLRGLRTWRNVDRAQPKKQAPIIFTEKVAIGKLLLGSNGANKLIP